MPPRQVQPWAHGSRSKPGAPPVRAALRGTDCLPSPQPNQSRWESGEVRGRDGEDAGVRSCNTVGQGECRGLRSGYPRGTECNAARRAVAGNGSGRGSHGLRALIKRSVDVVRRDSGAVPWSPAGADTSRGVGRSSPRARRSSRHVCPVFTGPRVATHRCLSTGRLSQSCRQMSRVSPQLTIRATHRPGRANFVPAAPGRLHRSPGPPVQPPPARASSTIPHFARRSRRPRCRHVRQSNFRA